MRIATGRPYVGRQAGALRAGARTSGAVAVWGVRAWGLPASAVGLPFVVRDPVRTLDDLDPTRDPAWVHVPGAWWGSVDSALSGALLMSGDPARLAQQLGQAGG